MLNNITGIILAGGKSTRMGTDKGLLKFEGETYIQILLRRLSGLFSDLIIIANRVDLYERYGFPVFPDRIADCGPLGGLYTGLLASGTLYNFMIACDMPFIKQELIEFIVSEIDGSDVVIPKRNGRPEPLCAIYSKRCIGNIKEQLDKNNFKMTDFIRNMRIREISEEETLQFDHDEMSFININTPSEHTRWSDGRSGRHNVYEEYH